jgi:hypothetical protein
MSEKRKIIPTEVKSVYRGDFKSVASEANMKKPDNAEDVIARNTTKTIQANKDDETCKKRCRNNH